MRRLFTVFALVAVLAPPVFASPPDDDPPDTASVAPAADVEIAPIVTGAPGVELVEAFAPAYPEPIGRVIERAHRIDVPPPNVSVLHGSWRPAVSPTKRIDSVTPSGLAQRRASGLTAVV
jgi:hypothetical protein